MFTALALSREVQARTGLSIRKRHQTASPLAISDHPRLRAGPQDPRSRSRATASPHRRHPARRGTKQMSQVGTDDQCESYVSELVKWRKPVTAGGARPILSHAHPDLPNQLLYTRGYAPPGPRAHRRPSTAQPAYWRVGYHSFVLEAGSAHRLGLQAALHGRRRRTDALMPTRPELSAVPRWQLVHGAPASRGGGPTSRHSTEASPTGARVTSAGDESPSPRGRMLTMRRRGRKYSATP